MEVRKDQLSQAKQRRAQLNEKASEGPDAIDSDEDGILLPDGTRPK